VSKKIIKHIPVKNLLQGIGGEYAPKLVETCIKKNKGISDEELGKVLKIKITEIRAILNQLHYRGIANYQKNKNKKTGWYNYLWEIRAERIAELIIEKQEETIKKIEAQIEYQDNYTLFVCKKNCKSIPFEVAAEYYFNCPNCGEPMKTMNTKTETNKLKKELEEKKKELEVILKQK
jgi:transcription initiation factor TFIIE subunit alpha